MEDQTINSAIENLVYNFGKMCFLMLNLHITPSSPPSRWQCWTPTGLPKQGLLMAWKPRWLRAPCQHQRGRTSNIRFLLPTSTI